MSWWRYVESVTHDGPTSIASKVGVSGPSVSRWNGTTKRPDPAVVAAFARAYDRPVLEAFIAAGFLTAAEAGEKPAAPAAKVSLTAIDDDDLVNEVARRIREGGTNARSAAQEKTPSGVPDAGSEVDVGGTVTELDRPGEVLQQRAARKNRRASKDQQDHGNGDPT